MIIPQPTIQQAVSALRERDEFKVIVQFVRDERDRLFGDLGPAETPNEVMKIAGGVARLDELLQVLDG
jgi:hypothetical protein